MRIIKKQIKFRNSNTQKVYFECFNNYKEFLDKIQERQPNAKTKIDGVLEKEGCSWVGVNTVQEAYDLLLKGWDKQVEALKKEFNTHVNEMSAKRVQTMFNDVTGFMPIVPNALMGLPKSMINCNYSKKKQRIIKFMVAIDRAARFSTEDIIKRMSKILAYIAMLERSGEYRCRLEVFFTAFGDCPNSNKTFTSVSILVKSENQLFDIKRLCFPVIHPAMLRLFGFAWEESLPMKYDEYYIGGYGTSFEYWDDEAKQDFKNAMTECGESVMVIDLFTDMDKLFQKKGGR